MSSPCDPDLGVCDPKVRELFLFLALIDFQIRVLVYLRGVVYLRLLQRSCLTIVFAPKHLFSLEKITIFATKS